MRVEVSKRNRFPRFSWQLLGRTREGGIADADLAALVTAWPALPEPIKAAIRALLGTVAGPS